MAAGQQFNKVQEKLGDTQREPSFFVELSEYAEVK